MANVGDLGWIPSGLRRAVLVCALSAFAGGIRAESGGPLAEQAVYIVDSEKDEALCLVDRDGSGLIEPLLPDEVVQFYGDGSPGPDLSVPSALVLGPDGELFLLDGGTLDAIYVLRDQGGDGAANGEGEWAVFYDDSSPGPNLSTPGDMTIGKVDVLYVCDDGKGAERILRLADGNGDGDALDEGEWAIAYDKNALAPPGGPLFDIEGLAALPDGRLLASDSTLGKVFALADLTGDGDFLDEGEAAVFYDPLGTHPFAQIQGLAAGPSGEVYAADAGTGLVVRLVDLDGDGDALETGESAIFLDPALTPELADAGDISVGPDGTLVVLDRRRNQVLLARDLDGDGAPRIEGEFTWWIGPGKSPLSTPVGVAIGPAPPAPAVVIRGVEPASGPVSGGTPVRISGKFEAFESATVTFGGSPAAISGAGADAIECTSPPATSDGSVDLRVTTAAGEAVLAAGFRYAGTAFVRGDGNVDGKIDISDAIFVLNYLFLGGGAPPACMDALDTDDDGDIAITDAIFLLEHLFLAGGAIPPPGPVPGFDATPDGIGCGSTG